MSNTDNRENLKQKIINIVKYIVLALCVIYIISIVVPEVISAIDEWKEERKQEQFIDALQSFGTTNYSNSSQSNYSDRAGDYRFRDSNDNIWIATLQRDGRAALSLNDIEIDYGTWEVVDWWDDELDGCIKVSFTEYSPYIVFDDDEESHSLLWFRNKHVYTDYEAAKCEHPRKRLRYYKLDDNL